MANNITRLSLETSKDIINNVERIRLLTNKTLEDVRFNLDIISSALDGVSDLTTDLVAKVTILPSVSEDSNFSAMSSDDK